MNSQQTLTQAASPLVLSGKEYLMSPLSDRDIAEMDLWLQERYIQNAIRAVAGDAFTDAQRKRVESLAMDNALGVSMASGIGAKIIATPEGMARLIWQGCRKSQPDLLLTEISAAMLSPENIDAANRIFNKLNNSPSKRAPTIASADIKNRKGRRAAAAKARKSK